jgi:topoisomerase-4 subunit A
MTKTDIVQNIGFEKALSERYLAYALSTIMSRSLPDVRDGLKPVHRRLIYAMQQLHLNPNSSFKKSARVVGDVMGKFHPHGDTAIYDALVRLAQDFSVRYPLIEGQGNFGNIDGDNAAAMRYTEARLTEVSILLMEGLEENAIDFRSTYDGEAQEPIVFPSAFPNLLANGATGIAVGMATSIPPHNVDEICSALIHLIKKPDAPVSDLVDFIEGPDFPTGGLLVESKESILKSYETGRGSFRLRAQWVVEKGKGSSYTVIITEIPFQVGKSKLIERIANLLLDKKLPLLGNITDESTDEIRVVLEPKNHSVDSMMLMESLFRTTDLETRIPLNMNVLDGNNIPQVMSLKGILQAFLNHRKIVQERRALHRLSQILARLELLSGYLIAYLNLDEVIRIIREDDEPKQVMIERFKLSEIQAEAILNMRLRSLRKLQEIEIRQEYADLENEKHGIEKLLADPIMQWQKIKEEVKALQIKFSKKTILGKRRTILSDPPAIIDLTIVNEIEKEDVTIVCSQKNWIRCVKGHQETDLKYKDGDEANYILTAQTTDKLILFATNGRFYTLSVDKLPRNRGHGEALRLLIDLDNSEEIITMMVATSSNKDASYLVTATDGKGFVVKASDTLAQTRSGKQVLSLGEDCKAKACIPITGESVAVIGENRKLLIFSVSELPIMTRGRGVTLQKYKDGTLSDIKIFNIEDGLSWKRNSKVFTEKDLRTWQGKRAAAGRLAPLGFPRSNKFEV